MKIGWKNRLLHSLPWLVLTVLGIYAYTYFFLAPYSGFDFTTSDGIVQVIYVQEPGDLREGDRLVQVGEVAWQQYKDDLRQSLFLNTIAGDPVILVVERDGDLRQIEWIMPGATRGEITARLINVWLLAFVFWGFGTFAVLFIRASTEHRWLFASFHYVTAIWLMSGALSVHGLIASAIVLRIAIWLSLPIYLHLHWVFPRPIVKLPRIWIFSVYGVALVMAMLQWFQLLAQGSYIFAFLGSLAGSAGLILAHMILQKEARGALRPIIGSMLIVFIPLIALGSSKLSGTTTPLMLGALLTLPLLPTAYFYAFYHRRFRGYELRANRLISAYIFFILAATIITLATGTILVTVSNATQRVLYVAGLALIAAAGSAWVYTHFRRLVERFVLNAPAPMDQLRSLYAPRFAELLDEDELVELMRKELLPAMQIRQSALLRINEEDVIDLVSLNGVDESNLPSQTRLTRWSRLFQKRHNAYWPCRNDARVGWVQLVIPLFLGPTLLGLWLVGERDLDDYYAPNEVEALEGLAAQISLALECIDETEEILAFYQLTVEQHEEERGQTARYLHDRVLQQLGATMLLVEDSRTLPAVMVEGVNNLREKIYDLEAVSDFEDLRTALADLVDRLQEDNEECPPIVLNLKNVEGAYAEEVENHVYRIVEEALVNVLQHAQADTISITGGLYLHQIELVIRDDGQGFDLPISRGIVPLLKAQQYSLAAMKQRAAMIDGKVFIDSSEEGTLIRFYWREKEPPKE